MNDLIECTTTGCPETAPRPADCQWEPLWREGWRWRKVSPPGEPLKFMPSKTIYSCPKCKPVITG
ncbi:hypothetical protein [Streptomyces sp. NPDC087300]|uniref:hypothetical protein n=1 Tax=Streptomyces sp. NPDC087300 TaxID=3365780 RepID=UPI0037F45001